ncbi:hypothetical protein AAF712_011921 [Marasmius tenuissimus]|uniref:Gustatory receptor n=1 Tax=Marasmius tenuissimus TaxID=585030 RepID=A0ABR2ZKK7_9AGAR
MPFLDDSVLASVQRIIVEPIISMSIQFIAYGFYVLLFGMCIRTLLRKEPGFTRKLFLWWSIVLFILATISARCELYRFIAKTVLEFQAVKMRSDETKLDEFYTRDLTRNITDGFFFALFILTNIVTDSILMYRCYIIWGSRKRVIVLPLFAVVTFSVVGFTGVIMYGIGNKDQAVPSNLDLVVRGDMLEMIYMIASASVNALLTLLTAGRIWWITKEARTLMGRSVSKKYQTVVDCRCHYVLESGLLYPVFAMLHIALTETSDLVYVPVNFLPTVVQMGAIAPTLIIVRASLGESVESVHSVKFTTMRFQQGQSANTPSDQTRTATTPSKLEMGSSSGDTKCEDT